MNTRWTASPSITDGRVSPWLSGSVLPSSRNCRTSTSIGPPFSACIMISAPESPACRIARKIDASSSMNTPGYAMKSLNEVTPSPTSSSISFRTWSLTSRMIMWNP